jgi:hypothetical protein
LIISATVKNLLLVRVQSKRVSSLNLHLDELEVECQMQFVQLAHKTPSCMMNDSLLTLWSVSSVSYCAMPALLHRLECSLLCLPQTNARDQQRQLNFILVAHAREVGVRCGRIVRIRADLMEDQQTGMA